jgi:hypothetical protein
MMLNCKEIKKMIKKLTPHPLQYLDLHDNFIEIFYFN